MLAIEGGDMVKKEEGQIEDSIIVENLARMSRDHNIPVAVYVEGQEYTGIVKTILYNSPAYAAVLYMRWVSEDDPEKEGHALIPMSRISYITFTTEKGFLDNLVQ